MTETVDANSNVTRYAYDAANRITTVTDALGNQRAYTYNPGGKIMAIRDFDGNEAGFTYNPLGKVETYTDKEGQTVHLPMIRCGISVVLQLRIRADRNISMTAITDL